MQFSGMVNFLRRRSHQGHNVAILVNEDQYHFFQACNGDVIHHYRYNMRGHYARLWRLGIAVDFLDAQEVAAGDLRHYKAALLTMPLSLDATYFAHLVAFAEAGGLLISEACPGRWDKYGLERIDTTR